jgi:hypothetical protein
MVVVVFFTVVVGNTRLSIARRHLGPFHHVGYDK